MEPIAQLTREHWQPRCFGEIAGGVTGPRASLHQGGERKSRKKVGEDLLSPQLSVETDVISRPPERRLHAGVDRGFEYGNRRLEILDSRDAGFQAQQPGLNV